MKNNADSASIDTIVKALYESVSFAPDSQPDYKRLRTLFHPDGRVIPPREKRNDPVVLLDLDSFIKKSREFIIVSGLESRGFIEKELHRTSEGFGDIMQVFSTYESSYASGDMTPMQSGINSIQLMKDEHRWWVLTILWDIEKPGSSIPPRYI